MKQFANNIRKYKVLYLLMLPGLLYYIIFCYLPMYGVAIAFEDYNILKGVFHSKWVGIKHFQTLFDSAIFLRVLTNTLVISTLKLICGFPVPIILALMLNEIRSKRFKSIIQTVSYLPNFVSWVVISGIMYSIFNPYFGSLASLSGSLNIQYVDISNNPDYFRAFLVLTSIWKSAGWSSIIYLAALAGIDVQLYEAAVIDGANNWKKLIHITLPSIMPVIAIIFILAIGSLLTQDFEQIYIMSKENPALLNVADVFESYVYRSGIREFNFSFPATVGIFQSFFGMILILATNKVVKKMGFEGIW